MQPLKMVLGIQIEVSKFDVHFTAKVFSFVCFIERIKDGFHI